MENLVGVGVFVAVFLIACGISVFLVRRSRGLGKLPFTERMLRPPGYGLRQVLEKLEEELLDCFMKMALLTGATAFCFLMAWTLRHWWLTSAICIVLGALLMALPIRWLVKLGEKITNYRLGLLGEEVVGEQLNRLMLDGCEVFHDVPGDGEWNVDHVVVSPRGVFAVETKSRRKQREKDGHKVVFTGTELQFPNWTDPHGLKQAALNADWLSGFLSKATGERVKASPILTLPGWMIERRGKNGVSVLNQKEIRRVVLDERLPRLDEAQRQRICHQLDQRCRDVEV